MMIRPSPRAVLRPQLPQYLLARRATAPARRFISFAPPSTRPRSFKNFAARCAIAAGGVWWYMNTDIFAEEGYARKNAPATYEEDEQLPTVEQVSEARKQRQAAMSSAAEPIAADGMPEGDAVADLEEEAGQQGAFNEETGEINWDCPCLGGMAHGPCGPEFREAFSCFVYSKEEPKGMDCIDRFKGMQDCFRQHPDVYGAELADDEADDDEEGGAGHAQVQMQEQEQEQDTPAPALAASSPESPVSATTQRQNSAILADGAELAQSSSPPSISHPTTEAVREKTEEVPENATKEPKKKRKAPRESST